MDIGKLLSWIPGWLGFLALIIVGVAMTLNGAINPNLDHVNPIGFIIFGVCSVAVGVFSWIVGATSEIKGRTGTVSVKVAVTDLPWWGWVVDIGIVAISVILFLVLK